MRKKIITMTSLIIISLIILTTNVYASEPINPNNNVYKEGIYKLNKIYTDSYELQFRFIDTDKDSAIIILDENADIVYKNINCNRLCNAGTITNKNTIIIISEGEVELNFTKISQ